MSEDTTIRQQIVLEDKVTPALDAMMKAIQGTSTAMGTLIDSITRFEEVAPAGNISSGLSVVANSVQGVSAAYEAAAHNAQALAEASESVSAPTAAPEPPEDSVSRLDELRAEFESLKAEAATMFEPATTAASQFYHDSVGVLVDGFREAFGDVKAHFSDFGQLFADMGDGFKETMSMIRDDIAGVGASIKAKVRPAFEAISNVAGNVSGAIKRKFGPAFTAISNAGNLVARMIGNRMQAAVEVTSRGLNKVKSSMSSVASAAKSGLGKAADWAKAKWQEFKESRNSPGGASEKGGNSGFFGGALGKLMLVAGSITAAVAGVNKIAEISDARSNSIAQINQLSDEQRNGYNAGELRDYGVKYANRIGMSSDEFMNQSLQLMNSTGGAFGSIGEAMNYNELMQKQMKMAGVSASAADSVSLQWRQGLTKGFAAEEMNSVLENAPVLAQRLADTMGIEMGQLKDAASEGKITAEIAKKALFDNAEDINSKFEAMPKTWEQIGASIKNNAMQALDPILQKVSDLAQNPAIGQITDKLTEGFAWFADVAGNAIDMVLEAISVVAPYVEQIVTPIKEILFSVWDIIKGLIDDIGEMFTKDEEFGKSAQEIWGDFRSILERLKPIVEGFVNTIAGGIKILMGVAKNIITIAENARTGLHNLFSDDQLEYKSLDTDIFAEGGKQIADNFGYAIAGTADLIGDTLTKNLEPVLDKPLKVEPVTVNTNDRIDAGMTPGLSPAKPMHVKQVGKTKIDPESLQLLKDLAQAEIINRVNNIQPAINATFGDVHETADVDAMLDRLEQEVVSARGQNLMLQTGLQYAI